MNHSLSRIAAVALFLLAAGALAPRAAAAQEGATDVFFVMDASESMRRLDPNGLRVAFVQALADLLLSRGGDRVSVIRLGGSLESDEWTPVVLPLTEVPAEVEKREEVLDALKKALGAPAEGFGRGSDFNAAFQAGIFPEIGKSGGQRTSVVIVISDGTMEVIEGDRAPAVYLEAAKETDGRTLRDRVNVAAMEIFRRKVLPALSSPLMRTFVVPVAVGPAEDEARYVLKDLAGAPGAGRVLSLGEDLLPALAGVLRPFRGVPAPPWGYALIATPGPVEVAAGAEASVDVTIPAEALDTRILVLGPTSEYAVGISGTGELRLGAEDGVRVFGRFQNHRAVSVGPRDIPAHRLHIQNLGTAAASFRVAVACSFRLESRLSLESGDAPARGGDRLKADIGVADARRQAFATDPWLLKHLVSVVRLMDASGETIETRFRYEGEEAARKVREFPLDPGTPAGPFVFSASYALLDDQEDVLWEGSPAEKAVRVEAGAPVLQVNFAAARVFQGYEVGLEGQVTRGALPAAEVEVEIAAPGEGKEKASTLKAALRWDPARCAYAGSIRAGRIGKYEIRAGGGEGRGWTVSPGLRGTLDVGRRSLELLTDTGAPLEALPVKWEVAGEETRYLPMAFVVRASLLPGEKARLTAAARTHASAAGATLAVEGGDFELTSEAPARQLLLRLDPGKASGLNGELGLIEVQGTIGGEPVRRKAPVTTEAVPPREKKWTDALRRKEVLIAGIGGLSLVALLAVLWATVPRYRQQHLLHARPEGGWDEGALLSEMHRGWSPRDAFGTPEVKNSIQFRLSGRRGMGQVQVMARSMKPFLLFFQNDEPKTGWTVLSHGDRLKVRGARYQHLYHFLAYPLSPEEYQSLQGPVPEGDEAGAGPQTELIIEIPGAEAPAGGIPGMEEALGPSAPEAAPEPASAGFGGETPASAEAVEPTTFDDLDTILGKPGEPPAAPAAPAEKPFTIDDLFGKDAGPPPAAPAPAAPAEVSDEQDTIFEKFFDEGKAAAAASPEGAKEGTDAVAAEAALSAGDGEKEGTEIVGAAETVIEKRPGDGTEVIGSDVEAPGDGTQVVGGGVLADALGLTEDGFTEGDITKILEEAGVDEESDIVIDVPLEEGALESALKGAEDVFEVGSDGETKAPEAPAEAPAGEEIEATPVEEPAAPASGEEGFNPDLTDTMEKTPGEEGEAAEEELEAEIEEVEPEPEGILTNLLKDASETPAEAEGLSEMAREIEEGEEPKTAEAPEAAPTPEAAAPEAAGTREAADALEATETQEAAETHEVAPAAPPAEDKGQTEAPPAGAGLAPGQFVVLPTEEFLRLKLRKKP